MLSNHAGRKHIRFATLIALTFLFIIPSAMADTLFFSFDEWGKGFLCNGTGSSAMIPGCSGSPTTHLGSFARIPSGFTSDPTPGGGGHVMTFRLPFDIGDVDVFLRATDESIPGDLIRVTGNTVFFYSLQEQIGTGDCSTMTPPATDCDGVADVHALPSGRPEFTTMTMSESAFEGSNHGLFFLGNSNGDLVTFIPHSDELPACPPIPNCGPFNIAPPRDNPFRDVTGLPGAIALVRLPTDNQFDPIAEVPEPGSIWLLLAGCTLFFKKRATSH